jgi:hypothetical protein
MVALKLKENVLVIHQVKKVMVFIAHNQMVLHTNNGVPHGKNAIIPGHL